MWEFIIHACGIWGQLASCSRVYQEKMLLLHTWLPQPIKFPLHSPLEPLSICNRSLQRCKKCCEMFARAAANTLKCVIRGTLAKHCFHQSSRSAYIPAAMARLGLLFFRCIALPVLSLCATCLLFTDFKNCTQLSSTSTTPKGLFKPISRLLQSQKHFDEQPGWLCVHNLERRSLCKPAMTPYS